jgi:hypothetical protein
VAGAGGDQRDDDAAGEEKAADWKEIQARLCWGVESDCGEIEGDVVEGAKQLQAELVFSGG